MSEFGAHWERKMRTAFIRFDVDGDDLITRNDFTRIAENIIKTGQFIGSEADDIRKNYLELWEKYFKSQTGGKVGSLEEFLANLRSYGKSDLLLVATEQFSIFFDAVDTNKDDLIQLKEFIDFYNSIGISEELAKESFKALDTNHDGVLSREEFVTAGKDFVSLEEPSFPADMFYGPLI